MRTSISMRRKGLSQLAGWLTLPFVVGAWCVVLWVSLHSLNSQAYQLWPVSANAAELVHRISGLGGLGLLVALVVVWGPLRGWGSHPDRWRWIALLWSLLMVVPFWAAAGLHYNRYAFADLWRASVQWGPATVPAAVGSWRVWAVDGGLTLAAIVAVLLLVRGWKMLLPSLATFRAPNWYRRTALGLALGLAVVALWPPTVWRPQAPGGDVILISLDAFRADRMGVYGSTSDLTPRLDEFAQDAIVFSRAYCQEPWTLTSHMSMLTGLYPEVHGLDFGRSLSPRIWTLSERLRDAGWRTLGSVYDCLFLEPRFGYADGFDRYEVNHDSAMSRGRSVASRVCEGGPAFVFLHFYDPHSDRGSLPYESAIATRKRLAPDAEETFRGWSGPGGASETLHEVNEGIRTIRPEQRDQLERLYDAGVSDTDAAVGSFLDELRRAGRYDDALIIIVADHGEALGEPSHGRPHFMHEELIEATLHIPMLVKFPRQPGGTVGALVETVDILPTVCDALGLEAPELVQGRSLADAVGDTVPSDWRAFSFARSGDDHAITGPDGTRLRYRWDESAGVSFDTADSASAEFRDLAVEAIARFHRGNTALARRFGVGEVELSAADDALLRSLGYVQ